MVISNLNKLSCVYQEKAKIMEGYGPQLPGLPNIPQIQLMPQDQQQQNQGNKPSKAADGCRRNHRRRGLLPTE